MGANVRPLLRADLTRIAGRLGVPPEVVEKDYLLSYLLAGLAAVPELRGLVFKGGTALKKMYFGDYRFSEDLDFSAVAAPRDDALTAALVAAVRAAEGRLRERGPFRMALDRLPERESHPTGQEAFRVLAAFPWQRTPMVRRKVEVTHDEPVLLQTLDRGVLHGYEELDEEIGDVRLPTYALEEIVTEKLRALRQSHRRIEERGWTRPRARDYYDLWHLLCGRMMVDDALVRTILPRKLAVRDVEYESADDFFTPELVAEARKHWKASLGTFVATLPDVDRVLSELRRRIESLLSRVD